MNKIDIFQDKEFIALPQEKQTQVLTNYFDKNIADDEFVSLPQEKQTLIKQNFINSQLNISEQEKKEAPKKVESDLKLEEPTKNSFLDKVKDFLSDNLFKKGEVQNLTKEDVKFLNENSLIKNTNTFEEKKKELDLEIEAKADETKIEDTKKISDDLMHSIERLSRIDVNLFKNNPERKYEYLENIADILGKGGYALGQNDDGEYIAIDNEGNEKSIKNDFWKGLVSSIHSDIGELTGAMGGAYKGMQLAKNIPHPVGKAVTIAGSSAMGAMLGTGYDMTINNLKGLESLDIESIANELNKSAVLDLVGGAVSAGVIKVGGKIIELPKQARDYILNGNLNGAREILKKDLGVDEKYIEDALEQAKNNYKEVENYSKNIAPEDSNIISKAISKVGGDIRNKMGQQEELLAVAQKDKRFGSALIHDAVLDDKDVALNVANAVNKRAENVINTFANLKIDGTEIKESLKNYESKIHNQYSQMRDSFREAFKESDLKFDFRNMGIEEKIDVAIKDIIDPYQKDTAINLKDKIIGAINNTKTGTGISREIDNLIELRQSINEFYGRNKKSFKYEQNKLIVDLKQTLDDELEKAVRNNLPKEAQKPMIDMYENAIKDYREMFEVQETKLYKSTYTKGDGKDDGKRMNGLIEYAKGDEKELETLLKKLPFEDQQKIENSIVGKFINDNLIGESNELQVIDYKTVLKKIKDLEKFFITDSGKESINLIKEMALKYGDDFDLLKAAHEAGVKTSAGIATTIKGRIEYKIVKNSYDRIMRLIPFSNSSKRLALQNHISDALKKSRTPVELAQRVITSPDVPTSTKNDLREIIADHQRVQKIKKEEDLLVFKKAQEEKEFLKKQQEQKLKEEIENFKTPDIYESRVISRFADDNKFASFAQLVTRIQKGTATQPDIEQYIKLKNSINPDILEKNILKEKYPENAFSIHKLNDLKSFANEKVNEIISEDEFKALIYNLDKHNKLPNTTQEIENKYREKFYQLHKLYEEEKALKEIEKQTVEDTEKKAFEEAEKAGLIPFAKFGDNLLAGTVAGVETDEDGNIVGFDPEMFVAGLGGYTALKAALKNKEIQGALKDYAIKIVEYVDMNPAVYKQNGLNAMFVGAKSNDLYKYLKMQNKSTFPKIRVENVFLNKEGYSEVPKDIREIAEKRLNTNSDLSSMDTKKVKIEDIVPTQKNLNFDNLRSIDGLELEKDIDEIMAIEYNGKYYLNDGHHRVASLILKGEKEIEIKIINEITNDSKGFYSVLEKTVDEKVGGKIDSVSLAKVLEKNGVKQDELEWSGLKDLLDSKDKLTKEEIQNTINENRLVLEKVEKIDKAKYKNYKMDGGENYRELLFTSDLKSNGLREIDITIDRINNRQNELKKIAGKAKEIPDEFKDEWKKIWQEKEELIKKRDEFKKIEPYYSQHWNESNIVVFTRVDDRTIDNKKTLFIEELQSDWHQDGRKKGYGKGTKKVPEAPFKKNWHELGFKRMIQEAVENDYEKIAWTTGKQQASRYSLEKEIDTVVYNKQSGYLQASKNGDEVIFKKVASDEEVANLLGKEITNRLIDPKQSTRENIFVLQGEDVKFGGDGMKAFYDEIVPNTAKKLFKKYNVKPKLEELDDLEEMVWSVEITPKMKEDIKKYGQPLYAIGGALAIGNELSNNGDKDE